MVIYVLMIHVQSYEKITREHKGGTAKKLVLDDEAGGFWDKNGDFVK